MCLEPFGRLTAEHSAQLTGQEDEEAFNKTERYELWFQDIPRAVARYPDWTGNFPTLRLSNGRRQFLGVERK